MNLTAEAFRAPALTDSMDSESEQPTHWQPDPIQPESTVPIGIEIPIPTNSSDATRSDAQSGTRFRLRTDTSSASPKHAQTQKAPVEAQSDWQRVRAGGFELPDSELDVESSHHVSTRLTAQPPRSNSQFRSDATLTGLPDREEPAHRTGPMATMTTSKMASSPSVMSKGPLSLKAKSSLAAESDSMDKDFVSDPARSTQTQSTQESLEPFEAQRMALAKRVSFELTSQSPYPATRAPEYLEAPLGWGAVEQELRQRLEKCDALLKRNAFHSARDEAAQGLRRLCRTMDAHRKSSLSAPALEKALVALREDADFQNVHQQEAIQSLIQSHSTEALKGRPLDQVTAEIASQHYRTYARYQLVIAADGHPWSADLLYAFGKSLEKEGDLDSSRAITLKNQAVACYQAAMQVAPNQTDVANQLGYTLITLDRIDEAYATLSTSLTQKQTAVAWNNMAEIYRRRGANSSADYAVQQANALSSNQPQYGPENPLVTEVDPITFARISPMPLQTPSSTPNQSNATSSAVSSAPPLNASKNFFTKMFKR
jgi:tetratricopeptide (TPR) repeat protein